MADETNTTPTGDSQPAGGEGTSAPEALTADKVRTIVSGMLKTTVSKAVTDAVGGLKSSFEAEFAPLKEMLAKAKTEPTDKPEDKQPKAKDAPAVDPRIEAFEKKIAKLEAEHKAATERAAKERARAIELSALGSLSQHLSGKVRPEAVDVVVKLMKADGRIVYDDEGNASMRVPVSLGKGLGFEDQELPIDEAIPHWLKSKEAALFLPAPSEGAGGTKRQAPANRSGNGQFANGAPKNALEAFEAQHGSIESLLG